MEKTPNNEIKRHNHYVPEMYLKNWATGNKVNTYNLLVPHEKVPVWKKTSIEYTASINNLYVRRFKGCELDDFEETFMRHYENPAKKPFKKVCSNQFLTPDDWHIMIDFVAAQIVRTPAFYFKHLDIMKRITPDVMSSIGKRLKNYKAIGSVMTSRPKKVIDNLLPITINLTGIPADNDHEYVEIGTIVGKSTWLYCIENLLSKTSSVLHKHDWSIITASDGVAWPTSDDPVLCLNYYEDGDYDFGGGWDNAGSEIIMPINPKKAIYTQVGVKHPKYMSFDYKESILLKKLIVQHALAYVYTSDIDRSIPLIRQRTVLKKEYDDWYEKYQEGEVPYLEPYIMRNGEKIEQDITIIPQ